MNKKIVAGNKRYTKKYAEGGEIILGGGSMSDVQDRILEDGGEMEYSDEMEHGGSIAEGNYHMMLSQAKEVKHHADELTNILKNETEIEAWVVAKMEDVSDTLSDITHYLDGKSEYEQGGTLAGNLETDNIGFAKGGRMKKSIVNPFEYGTDEYWNRQDNFAHYLYSTDGSIYTKWKNEEINDSQAAYMAEMESGESFNPKTEYEQGGTLAGNLETDNIGFAKGGSMKEPLEIGDLVHVPRINQSGVIMRRIGNGERYSVKFVDGTILTCSLNELQKIADEYDYAHGGETHSDHDHKGIVDKLDANGNTIVDYDSQKKCYFWEDYAGDIYKDGFDTEEEAYESLAHHLQNKFKKGGTINKNKMARGTKSTSTGLKKAQTMRWTSYTTKAGQTKHKVESKPYKASSDASRPATPSGYRFSKVAEEKGITNNRFRRPTKAEIAKYANKKTKKGQLIMYKENRRNKVDLNPKQYI